MRRSRSSHISDTVCRKLSTLAIDDIDVFDHSRFTLCVIRLWRPPYKPFAYLPTLMTVVVIKCGQMTTQAVSLH